MPLANIIGHEHAVALLRRAVARDRVPQSLLLAGPDGVGKRAVAVALAQALNCPVRVQDGRDDACGTCTTCQRIRAGTHSDVLLLYKGDDPSIKIEPLRDRVLSVVGYRPFEARYRVFVIDPADAMTDSAQDALLKTLEEPPPAAVLILVSSEPDTLTATILSRCRRLRFGPLADDDVARVLVDVCDVDATDARALAAIAGGSVARALAEADEGGALEADRAAAFDLLTAAGGGAMPPRLKAATSFAKHGTKRRDREALDQRLAFVASMLRDLERLSAGRSDGLANADLANDLTRLLREYPADRAGAAFAAVGRARAALDRNASPKIVADWVAVTM